ncbi:MAG: hypothetical protein ABIP80_05635 [Ferruginibacter sp.]
MSFEKTRLPPSLISDLYRDCLIDETPETSFNSSISEAFSYLGNNEKNVLIIAKEIKDNIEPGSDLSFLTGILSACKLKLTDVAVIDINLSHINLDEISQRLESEKILLFGIEEDKLNLPMRFPNFQVQRFNSRIYLTAPSLSEIAHAKPLKKLLWESLQKIF